MLMVALWLSIMEQTRQFPVQQLKKKKQIIVSLCSQCVVAVTGELLLQRNYRNVEPKERNKKFVRTSSI